MDGMPTIAQWNNTSVARILFYFVANVRRHFADLKKIKSSLEES